MNRQPIWTLELINKNINSPRALSSGSPNLRKANEGFAEAIKKADDKFFKRADKFSALVKDLRDIFYHGE